MPGQIKSKAQERLLRAAAEGKSDKMSPGTAKKMLTDNKGTKVKNLPEHVKPKRR